MAEARSTQGDDVGLADDIDGLSELHRNGALTDEEFARAKRRLLDGAKSAEGADPRSQHDSPGRGRSSPGLTRRAWVVGGAAVVVLAVLASGIGIALSGGDGQQREDANCQQIADDLAAEGRPMAELYPTLRGMGCGEWLDEQFENNGAG